MRGEGEGAAAQAGRCRVKWYYCGWWNERDFDDRDQAEAFALAVSKEHRCEARLFVAGQLVANWRNGERNRTS
jgi:hypothetical protein